MKQCQECNGTGKVWDYDNVEYEVCHRVYEYIQEEYERFCYNCDGEGSVFKEGENK